MTVAAPAVSIIVPFYNAADFLKEGLNSILAQTFTDWELLLVDDASTDASRGIAAQVAASDPGNIRLLAHPDGQNHGLPATRNVGLRECRGEFVALLDADDVWHPTKLQEQFTLAREHPDAGMIFGRSQYWHSWNPSDPEPDCIPELAPGELVYQPPELWEITYPFGKFGSPCPSDLFFRRTALEAVGGFEESFGHLVAEDIALLSKIFLCFPVYVSSQCWDRYRRHDDSLWARALKDGSNATSQEFYFQWLREYLQKNGIRDSDILALLHRKTWQYRHQSLYRSLRALRSALRPVRRWLTR
ncbi:MAG: glycosyltransferase [Acidobacteriaceae bacterium]